ncbi:glycogen debranching N-terminal domain-containing protein [Pedococcus sp. 2YAF34]|uniref:glycogen debranching N-terminal domain-containing protein n=1 Tax=Pedococcus sp. 2YAF34 TaxID=3233032 RepID=UPI003F96941B
MSDHEAADADTTATTTDSATAGPPPRQPWLHQLNVCVNGNATALSSTGGDIEPGTAQGLYVDDVRVLSEATVRLEGEAPAFVAEGASGPRAEFVLSARNLGNPGPDPTVEVHRTRLLEDGAMVERVVLTSRAADTVRARLVLELAGDGAAIGSVKAGHVVHPEVAPQVVTAPDGDALVTTFERHATRTTFDPAPAALLVRGDRAVVEVDLVVEPGESAATTMRVETTRTSASVLDADPGRAAVAWDGVRVVADDPRLAPVVDHSMDDLRHLLLRDPDDRADVFAAAGTPWYLTLFGRDSIWAARMMLPFGTDLAAGTLRVLARRQGTRDDPRSAEAPGKIPHELRRTAYLDPESGLALPPVYYGTVDATALWVTLLVEAWQWGMPQDEVRALLPNLRAAVQWLTTTGQPDEDGLLKYLDTSGTGLANQGWKDSGDSIRWRDGHVADGPIALVEAQAYAVEALNGAARLLRALGEEGADEAEKEAEGLRTRLSERYWVQTDAGRHLAIALDGRGAAVDGLASNMGHVLGTGVLTPAESDSVAAQLTGDELLDEFGVRTLGSGNGGFNPIGYHTGSIWTHDTAIVALGLAREGHRAESAAVATALVASAEAFDYRWPELYSGLPMMGRPSPYPASCRPQAWSAASAGALVTVALGLRADLPAGVLEVDPVVPPPFGALRVEGLRLGDATVTVSVDRDGHAEVTGAPEGVEVRLGGTSA